MRLIIGILIAAFSVPSGAATSAAEEAAFQHVVSVLKQIKAANRNPASVQWEEIWANADASVICVDYRGQNGLGGMNRELLVVVKNTVYRQPSAWNKHCVKGGLKDMLFARQAVR